MNERIKQLAIQCCETGPIGKDGWPEYSKFNEEKFAMLIIRECTDLFADQSRMERKKGNENNNLLSCPGIT